MSAKPIEFKGTSLSVVSVVLNSLDIAILDGAITAMPGGKRRFFDGDAAVLDLSAVATRDSADWPALLALLRDYGLQPVAVVNGGAVLGAQAAAVGLVTLGAGELARPSRKPAAEKAPAPPPVATAMLVDKPLRSGQRLYARGTDLILTAMVSTGAEVIADGSIHVYAPLRGRALAGASGDAGARVFCTCFEAELVSVAGMYRTFEQGLPPQLAKKPVQVRLNQGEGQQTLLIEALSLG
ncbi:septum site-determining protein MinC [Denitratisoma oestradiolicum]|uniref:Probable septum site-determining protein MinC n=1 Tax=Denitratisoma oestradiolicum TaxID=311182 RepID=A0A6S6Y0L7_9PROT|nr:septum site-determining protein MinC [Denitratisoma oestradiolicum]TWO80137.1 septum site-determining protein MinC [Denitratisoma oestradiolicum]CAB1370025.1 putative septum site-determining protein MinC [Denitratisoma oestradiolicum]